MQSGPAICPEEASTFPCLSPFQSLLIVTHRQQTDHLWFTLLFHFPSFVLIPILTLQYHLLQTFSVCMIVSQQTLAPPCPVLPPTVPSLDGNQGAPLMVPSVRELHIVRPELPPDPPDPKNTVSKSTLTPNNVTPLLTKSCLTLPKQCYHEVWNTKIWHLKLWHCSLPTNFLCGPSENVNLPPINLEKHIVYTLFVDTAKVQKFWKLFSALSNTVHLSPLPSISSPHSLQTELPSSTVHPPY